MSSPKTRNACPQCGRRVATDEEWATVPGGERDDLCWGGQACEDMAPPAADAAILASANRMLMERVERLERVLAAEQGREGLEGFEWNGVSWRTNDLRIWARRERDPFRWGWCIWNEDEEHIGKSGSAETALEAMEQAVAAEAALRGEG